MPARLEIDGGVPLRGSVRVSAAKNAALPALAASLLTAEPVHLTNVPDLVDMRTMVRLIETLGATVRRERGELSAQVARVTNDVAPYELVSTMRASVLVLGPLVARHGTARVALPGGCAIGVRPIDQHLKGLARLGAEIAIAPSASIRAPIRASSATCMNRFSKIVSVTRDWPSASPSSVITCACMSVGKPGNGLVMTSAARGRSGPLTRTDVGPASRATPHSSSLAMSAER